MEKLSSFPQDSFGVGLWSVVARTGSVDACQPYEGAELSPRSCMQVPQALSVATWTAPALSKRRPDLIVGCVESVEAPLPSGRYSSCRCYCLLVMGSTKFGREEKRLGSRSREKALQVLKHASMITCNVNFYVT